LKTENKSSKKSELKLLTQDEYKLQKWDILHVWCSDLRPAHYKFCICICPERLWFYFINSELPYSRKAREVAVSISNFELHCIKHESFVDTTALAKLALDEFVKAASSEDGRRGSIPPSLRKRICEAAESHNVLNAEELQAVLDPALPKPLQT
jgi:hypothetical protein